MNHDVRMYGFASDMLCDILVGSITTILLIMPLILLAFLCELQISQSFWIASKLGCSVLSENKRYIFHFHQEFH